MPAARMGRRALPGRARNDRKSKRARLPQRVPDRRYNDAQYLPLQPDPRGQAGRRLHRRRILGVQAGNVDPAMEPRGPLVRRGRNVCHSALTRANPGGTETSQALPDRRWRWNRFGRGQQAQVIAGSDPVRPQHRFQHYGIGSDTRHPIAPCKQQRREDCGPGFVMACPRRAIIQDDNPTNVCAGHGLTVGIALEHRIGLTNEEQVPLP